MEKYLKIYLPLIYFSFVSFSWSIKTYILYFINTILGNITIYYPQKYIVLKFSYTVWQFVLINMSYLINFKFDFHLTESCSSIPILWEISAMNVFQLTTHAPSVTSNILPLRNLDHCISILAPPSLILTKPSRDPCPQIQSRLMPL